QQELHRSRAALFGPHAHADRRHEHQVEPRVPAEEAREARLAALEEAAGREGEEAREQQEDDQEHVGHRAREVSDQLALGEGPDDLHASAPLISPLIRGALKTAALISLPYREE